MKLYEVHVLSGAVALFNPDRDEIPRGLTFASEQEYVGVFRLDTFDRYVDLLFLADSVILFSDRDTREDKPLPLSQIGLTSRLELFWNRRFLCNIGIAFVAMLDEYRGSNV